MFVKSFFARIYTLWGLLVGPTYKNKTCFLKLSKQIFSLPCQEVESFPVLRMHLTDFQNKLC